LKTGSTEMVGRRPPPTDRKFRSRLDNLDFCTEDFL